MARRTLESRSRRALLTGAGGLGAVLATAARGEGQPQARSTSEARDRGVWATWYDLPEAGRGEYLAWAHESYIPGLLKHPGYLWAAHYVSIPDETAGRVKHTDDAAVPSGRAYILVVGGEDSNVFGRPAPEELHGTLSSLDKKMLAMRTGERVNIFAEGARITGPGSTEYKDGMTLAPCIQFGTYNVDYRKEVDILAWYAQLQMPNMMKAPGCVRTRKLASVFGWAKMGILYEFSSVDIRLKTFGPGREGGGGAHKWQGAVRDLVHAPGSPNVARRIWPA